MSDTTSPLRVAVVHATWHADLVDVARDAFVAELGTLGVDADHVEHFGVPGALEIPLHAQRLAASGRYDAVVAIALVVDGGIFRHEFVADAVVSRLVDVGLASGVPVLSVVLTPHHFRETGPIADFYGEHMATKGVEAAQSCVATVRSLRALPTS